MHEFDGTMPLIIHTNLLRIMRIHEVISWKGRGKEKVFTLTNYNQACYTGDLQATLALTPLRGQ